MAFDGSTPGLPSPVTKFCNESLTYVTKPIAAILICAGVQAFSLFTCYQDFISIPVERTRFIADIDNRSSHLQCELTVSCRNLDCARRCAPTDALSQILSHELAEMALTAALNFHDPCHHTSPGVACIVASSTSLSMASTDETISTSLRLIGPQC